MSAALFSTASSDKHCRRGRPSPARPLAGAREGQGREMPNQPPAAQLNLTFTHSFTRNNNNLTLFGFLPYFCFCCLSLFLSPSLSTTPRLRERGRKGRLTGRMVPSLNERPLRQAKPSRPYRTTDRLQPASSVHPQKARAAASLFATIRRSGGGGGWRGRGRSVGRPVGKGWKERGREEESGGTIEAKQNTVEEKGRERERPSLGLAGGERERWFVARLSDTDEAFSSGQK